ncbi:MAG: PrgI family protein [Candidatus Parcubacteria bacterium]|nr:PrgI family protein [Candidatus Parcubacteria bacterium]
MSMLGPFLVPQFIDIETKIIGPVTTRQFLIMMVCAMIDFILYKTMNFTYFIVSALIITLIFLLIAFFKINGMPMHYFFLNLLQTLKKPKMRIWKKVEPRAVVKAEKMEVKKEFIIKPPLVTSRLSSLSLIINTGGAYQEEE